MVGRQRDVAGRTLRGGASVVSGLLGDVDWTLSQSARDWYARMKSRPCFRGVLAIACLA